MLALLEKSDAIPGKDPGGNGGDDGPSSPELRSSPCSRSSMLGATLMESIVFLLSVGISKGLIECSSLPEGIVGNRLFTGGIALVFI